MDKKLINDLGKQEKTLLLAALIIHLITAFFSNGFYHWDEHFQIFEFAQYKLGHIPADSLPWEFASRMRPWFLPGLATALGSIIANPFVLAGTMRFLVMLLCFGASLIFYLKTKDEFEQKHYTIYLFLSFLLWFLPYLHVRVSAEMIGGALFILAYSLVMKEKTPLRLIFSGLLFGLGFWIRFQMGFALLGLGIGYLIIKKFSLKEILLMLWGFFTAVIINVGIDSWGYGEFTFAPWQYLHENIILGKSKNFGVNPLSDYFKWILNSPGFPIGILIYTALISQIKNHWKQPLTLATILFLLAHFAVSHKEIRFLFPLLFLIPYFVMKFLSLSLPKLLENKVVLYLFLVLNLIPMMALMNTEAHPSVNFFKMMVNHPEIKKMVIQGETDPYHLAGLPVSFYHQDKPERSKELSESPYVFSDRVKYARLNQKKGCELLYTNSQIFASNLDSSMLKDKKRMWTLYKCTK